ncbi:MAG: hypothetical protein QXQ30_02720 [Candidatus Pacearchaeota archaeon]
MKAIKNITKILTGITLGFLLLSNNHFVNETKKIKLSELINYDKKLEDIVENHFFN